MPYQSTRSWVITHQGPPVHAKVKGLFVFGQVCLSVGGLCRHRHTHTHTPTLSHSDWLEDSISACNYNAPLFFILPCFIFDVMSSMSTHLLVLMQFFFHLMNLSHQPIHWSKFEPHAKLNLPPGSSRALPGQTEWYKSFHLTLYNEGN